MRNILRRRSQETTERTTPVAGFGTRTPEQIAEALAKAQAARAKNAEILGDIRKGVVTLAQVLEADYEHAERVAKIRVAQLVRAVPKVGPKKAEQVMDDAGIIENRKAGGLTPRQKQALLDNVSQ
jgi:hypothetical protein